MVFTYHKYLTYYGDSVKCIQVGRWLIVFFFVTLYYVTVIYQSA